MSWNVLLLLLLSVQNIKTDGTLCQTPSGTTGQCIPLDNCPSLSSFFDQGALSLRTKTYLKKSQCGTSYGKPKVCCPVFEPAVSSPLLPDITTCGELSSQQFYIVGGDKTDLDEFPWTAILQYEIGFQKIFECGGALINKRYVLTAAHCLLPSLIKVRLGEYNTETDPDCIEQKFGRDCAPPAVDFGIEEKIPYSTYNENDPSHYHDIGLIRLDRDVEYNDFIKPICLPLAPEEIYKNYIGQSLVVVGWGQTENGTKSTTKLKAFVPVKALSECTEKLHRLNPRMSLDEGQMCAGGENGRDSCTGDSGGPLMALTQGKDSCRLTVVGVVSYGPTPCGRHLPGVYTKVARYVSWIVNTIRP